MRVYRCYDFKVGRIKVAGCKDCPAKNVKRYQSGGVFSSGYVCPLLKQTRKVQDGTGEWREIQVNPNIKEEMANDGIRFDCPLPVWEE